MYFQKLFILQAGNTGQLQAFQEFQGSTATGGNVGNLGSKAQLLASGSTIATTDDGHSVGVSQCPLPEWGFQKRP